MNVINIKLFISFLLFAAGLVGFYVLLDEPVVFRILSVLVGVVASLFVFWTTPLGQQAIGFLKEAVTEAKKSSMADKKRNDSDDFSSFCFSCFNGNIFSFC